MDHNFLPGEIEVKILRKFLSITNQQFSMNHFRIRLPGLDELHRISDGHDKGTAKYEALCPTSTPFKHDGQGVCDVHQSVLLLPEFARFVGRLRQGEGHW